MNLLPTFAQRGELAPLLNRIHHADALALLRRLPDASIDLIATDPPYFGVKDSAWDNAWNSDAEFLAWLKTILAEYKRVLAPNGSLYLFASPRMAARVEVAIGEYFNVLNHISWLKPHSRHNQVDIDILRGYFPQTERIIFAEQYSQISQWDTTQDDVHAYVMKPLKDWFRDAVKTHKLTLKDVNRVIGSVVTGGGMASHYFGEYADFQLPTSEMYQKMKTAFPNAFNREYEDLRREYEDLRREYEDLRRPFNASPYRPYTDVWTYKTVQAYAGKHECEKPIDMMRHIIETSSRKGGIVLDTFSGSGTTLDAARQLKRQYIGCDMDSHWVKYAERRLSHEYLVPMFAELSA